MKFRVVARNGTVLSEHDDLPAALVQSRIAGAGCAVFREDGVMMSRTLRGGQSVRDMQAEEQRLGRKAS